MAMKKFLKGVEAKEALTIEDLSKVYKAIDKAAKVGIIKKRNAARKRQEFQRLLILLRNSPLGTLNASLAQLVEQPPCKR